MKVQEFPQHLIEQLRSETPGCAHKLHLNNAGASLMPLSTFERVASYQKEELLHGGYETALKYQNQLAYCYHQVAQLISAEAEEIAFMENATVAWNMAFQAIHLQEGDEILTTSAEYASNFLVFLQAKKRFGIKIKVVPNLDGRFDSSAFRNAINPNTKLICITHMPTNGGLVNPAEAIGKIASEYGIDYLLDACQSLGQYPLDVKKIGCTFLSATGRKYLRGPRGTGILFIKKEKIKSLEPPFVDLKGALWTSPDRYELSPDATRFENWERNPALQLGIGAAAEYAKKLGMEMIWKRVQYLATSLRNKLETISNVQDMDIGDQKSGIVSIALNQADCQLVKTQLLASNINVSLIDPNNTLLDSQNRKLKTMIRASVHYYNTLEELDHFCKRLDELLQTKSFQN